MIKYKKFKRLPIQNSRNSSFIALVIVLFIAMSMGAYTLLRINITDNHQKELQILVYRFQTETSTLLAKLLYRYVEEEKNILKVHKKVVNYLNQSSHSPLNIDLNYIHKEINHNKDDNPYEIYIADENLLIKNTTFTNDLNFSLEFARKLFDEHFESGEIGYSSPLQEKSSKMFISFTDSFLSSKKKYLLQIGYKFTKSTQKLKELQSLIHTYPNIVNTRAYITVGDYTSDIMLSDFVAHKPSLEKIYELRSEASKVLQEVSESSLTSKVYEVDGVEYTQMYIRTSSPILEDIKIVYSVLIDNSAFNKKIVVLNISFGFILLIGIIAILFTFRLRKKESQLNQQTNFMQSSMHEIKTPLSIITLNHELRELAFGDDEYSREIDSAIKTLKISYDDMSYALTKQNVDYIKEDLDLSEVLYERVDYFQTIAQANSKNIVLNINSNCKVYTSKIELLRLIDNNLSNALKYSANNSEIVITLTGNILDFWNQGEPIKNSNKVFEKYFRENSIVGGHGLGLSIVKEIASKYDIKVAIRSSVEDGTHFFYTFKCHMSDI